MEGIGEKLRATREAKKLTIRDVARDTNMSAIYIEALENEEFEKFPGETYVTGFLRSYAEYLKMDADEIIQSYKGYKIGESTTPIEELTKPTGPSILSQVSLYVEQYKSMLLGVGVVLVILIVGWLAATLFTSDIDIEGDDSIANIQNEYKLARDSEIKIEKIHSMQLTNQSGFILLYNNEAAQFMVDNKEVMFIISDIADSGVTLQLLPEGMSYTLKMEKPVTIDAPGVPRDVIVTLKGLTDNRAKLRVMLGGASNEEVAKAEDQKSDIVEPEFEKEETQGTQVVAHTDNNLKIVFDAEFNQKTYLELYLDGNEKVKGIIPAGTRERWEASEYIQLKIGNAGGLKAKINGKPYTFGLPGQIANKVITWRKDPGNPNKYHIQVKDW
ncbi:MAG: helix-turn-helix domain-containing protein [Spirochaetota bacterium]